MRDPAGSPLPGVLPSGAFARRRERVLGALEDGALLLPAAPLLFRSRDTQHPYRPDSELFYLTGLREPGGVAVLRGGGAGAPLTLFVPERDPKGETWTGPRWGPQEALEHLGADAAYRARELEERLPELLRGARRIFFRLGVHPRLDPLVLDALRWARTRGSRKGEGPRGVLDPGELLDELRLRKDPEEVACIRRAAGLTMYAFREAMAGARPGAGEWEVQAILEGAIRRGGGSGPAFPSIVGAGANGCYLHYAGNRGRVGEGEMILLDGGAEVDLYCADVARTFLPPGLSAISAQKELHGVVLGAHAAATAAVRPGARVGEVHEAAVRALTEGLVELGVLAGEVEELLAGKAYEPFFPHQTSHWLGLDVHDVGDYARDGLSRVLEPGMVLTVEPGLYFPPGPGAPTTPFLGLAVRVEDDLLVTEKGAENLTAPLTTALEPIA